MFFLSIMIIFCQIGWGLFLNRTFLSLSTDSQLDWGLDFEPTIPTHLQDNSRTGLYHSSCHQQFSSPCRKERHYFSMMLPLSCFNVGLGVLKVMDNTVFLTNLGQKDLRPDHLFFMCFHVFWLPHMVSFLLLSLFHKHLMSVHSFLMNNLTYLSCGSLQIISVQS